MKKQTPARTNFALFVQLMEEVGGKPMKEAFMRDMAPYVRSMMVDKELTEEEFQDGLKNMREETPAFLQYLQQLGTEPM